MTYELAKEVKNAGFPQPALDFKGAFLFAEYGEPVDTQAYAPTLSELIVLLRHEETRRGRSWI
jgi:hypothetical protein